MGTEPCAVAETDQLNVPDNVCISFLRNVATLCGSATLPASYERNWHIVRSTGIPRYTRSHFTRFRYNAI